ncbi:MAG: Rieske 2Fe-2S domain-containing protein [Actinomycetota bacterium]
MSDDAPKVAALGDLSDLIDGDMRVFEDIGDYGIVVCRADGELYAIEDNCSHADTPLSEGRLRGFNLVCPLHGASFDVRDGSHSGPPAWEGVPCHRLHGESTEVSVDVAPISEDDPDDNRDVGGRFLTR